MTTSSWSGLLEHTSNATFRAWGSDYSAHLAAIGLVKTADTGQIDWTTAVYSTLANSVAGYEIWRFNDSLQATAPIYVKIEYGTGAGEAIPGMYVTAGTGTNGTGTLTGLITSRMTTHVNGGSNANNMIANTTTLYPSYFCHTTGHLGCAFRVPAVPQSSMCFGVSRYCDDDGTPNTKGFVLWTGCNGALNSFVGQSQSVRTAAPTKVHTVSYRVALFPGNELTSLDEDGNLNVYGYWAPTTKMRPMFNVCGYLFSEIATGSTFQVSLVGGPTKLRTFIAVGSHLCNSVDQLRAAMIWE